MFRQMVLVVGFALLAAAQVFGLGRGFVVPTPDVDYAKIKEVPVPGACLGPVWVQESTGRTSCSLVLTSGFYQVARLQFLYGCSLVWVSCRSFLCECTKLTACLKSARGPSRCAPLPPVIHPRIVPFQFPRAISLPEYHRRRMFVCLAGGLWAPDCFVPST